MSDPSNLRVGIFRTLDAAETAVAELMEAGFPDDSINVITPSPEAEGFEDVDSREPPGRRTPKAVAAGGAVGGLVGGLGAAVTLATPAGPAVLVVGPLLAGLASGGVFGGLIGAMTSRGVQPDVADFYDRAVRKGRTLVAVEGAGEAPALEKAEEVLCAAGAEPLEFPR